MLKASVSGSFHRHMPAIYTAVNELRAGGVDVLSPSDPRVVDHLGEFLFVASDKLRSVKLVQDRHFEAIKRSDFLWVVCPDGYTGASTSAEIGAAYATGIPAFSTRLPLDTTLQHYVRRVPSIDDLLTVMRSRPARPIMAPHILVDPDAAIETSHVVLDRMNGILAGRWPQQTADREIENARAILKGTLGF